MIERALSIIAATLVQLSDRLLAGRGDRLPDNGTTRRARRSVILILAYYWWQAVLVSRQPLETKTRIALGRDSPGRHPIE